MSKVGEPMDLISELTDIKRRLESLEARILSLNDKQFDPRLLGEKGGVRY